MAFFSPLNPPMSDWRDKTVWVVGASSGIGQATAAQLHGLGARVVVSARKVQSLDAFVLAHPGSQALALDVTDAVAVGVAAEAAEASAAAPRLLTADDARAAAVAEGLELVHAPAPSGPNEVELAEALQ